VSEQSTTQNVNHTPSGRLVLIAAVVLGIAALLTAWSSYRSNMISGGVAANYASQQELQSKANDYFAISDRFAQADQTIFLEYVSASAHRDQQVLDTLHATMDPRLAKAIDWWIAQPDAQRPSSPFVNENPEFTTLESEVARAAGWDFLQQSQEKRTAAEAAASGTDRFQQANVFFAVVLFLAGIATLLQWRRIQLGVLVLAIVLLVIGLVWLFSSPGALTV